MNYIFHIRDWNIDFFLELEEYILYKDFDAGIVRLTMMKSVEDTYLKLNKNIAYIPELSLSKVPKKSDIEFAKKIDNFLFDKYSFGIDFLYEIERFKPDIENKNHFVLGQLSTLNDLIKPDSILISLSCDHFIYIISAYLNEFKGGKNFYIQPIGFPRGAQVILSSPWNLNLYKDKPYDVDHLQDYIDSLCLDPKESIHYMKPKRNISLSKAIVKKVNDSKAIGLNRTMFQYLEPSVPGILPSRFKRKEKNRFNFKYLSLETITSSSKKSNVFYFPLQLEPEMSILAYSPFYKSQIEAVRLICQSLKLGDILLLKENPKMIGVRHDDFYNEISSFSNVKWAHPSLNSRDIIRTSFKVISMTGTATIEAACLGINSLIFGNPPFKELLVEKPIADQSLSEFPKILYNAYSPDEILNNLNNKWAEFSRCIFFGNIIPEYINDIFKIKDSENLARRVAIEILQLK